MKNNIIRILSIAGIVISSVILLIIIKIDNWHIAFIDMGHPLSEISTKSQKDIKYLQKLAENGDTESQLQLGLIHFLGQGTEINKKEGIKWIKKSTTGLKKLADNGDSDAQLKLGIINDECMKNYDEAFKWLKKSAEQGNITAQYNIGIMYNVGKGTKKNKAEAVKWLKKSAEQGNNYAQNYLKLYNNVETIKWIVIIVIAITIILLLKNIILSEKAEQ